MKSSQNTKPSQQKKEPFTLDNLKALVDQKAEEQDLHKFDNTCTDPNDLIHSDDNLSYEDYGD
jgi:hypothetical protein